MNPLELRQDLNELEKAREVKDDNFVVDYSNYVYDNDIIEIIKELDKRNIFAYNSTVIEEALKIKKFQTYDTNKLSALVYFCQKIKRGIELKKEYDQYIKDNSHHLKISEIDEVKAIKEKAYFTIHSFGKQPFEARLLRDADNTLFFMKPRFKRRGTTAHNLSEVRIEGAKEYVKQDKLQTTLF